MTSTTSTSHMPANLGAECLQNMERKLCKTGNELAYPLQKMKMATRKCINTFRRKGRFQPHGQMRQSRGMRTPPSKAAIGLRIEEKQSEHLSSDQIWALPTEVRSISTSCWDEPFQNHLSSAGSLSLHSRLSAHTRDDSLSSYCSHPVSSNSSGRDMESFCP